MTLDFDIQWSSGFLCFQYHDRSSPADRITKGCGNGIPVNCLPALWQRIRFDFKTATGTNCDIEWQQPRLREFCESYRCRLLATITTPLVFDPELYFPKDTTFESYFPQILLRIDPDKITDGFATGPQGLDLVSVGDGQDDLQLTNGGILDDAEKNLWEVRFKRRILGKVQFRIEYERRGDRSEEPATVRLAKFPQAGLLPFYIAVRAGGRLEIEPDSLPQGWQAIDWNTVPTSLRNSVSGAAPVVVLKAQKSAAPLNIKVERHSLADSLKLRVANGILTTVLSPNGDQLTAVDVTMEVIQRSSLSVGLPTGGDLFSIFVNGESVHSIRAGGETNSWQFYILPGMDDRTANVRFVYTVPGKGLEQSAA